MNIAPARFINRLSAVYIILFCFVPSVQVENIYRLVVLAASAIWVISALGISSGTISKEMGKFILIAATCVALMFIWRTNIGSISSAFANVLQPIIMILVALISMFMLEYDSEFFNILLTAILILVCVYCVITIQATLENPYASRIANSEWLEERYAGNEHVGLYGYVYMCVFFVPIILYKIVKKIHINLLVDILAYVALVLIIIMVALAGYMIAILCTILGIAMVALLNKITPFRIFLVICIGIVLWVYRGQIIEGIIEGAAQVIGDNPVYNDKLEGFRNLYKEGELGDSSWEGRLSNYAASFRNIIQYPMFGCYFSGNAGGGGHSTVLDTIGRFGWVIAFLYFKITWDYPRRLVSGVSKKHPLYFMILTISVIFGLLDPYCQEMALPWFIFMPYIVYLEKNQSEYNVRRGI